MTEKSNPFADLVAWVTLLDAWGLLFIASIFGAVVFMFWRMNRSGSSFSLSDSLLDPMTGKTSYVRTMVFGSFIGAWLCVLVLLIRGGDVFPLVTLILGTFVVKSVFDRGADVVDPRIKAQAQVMSPPNGEAPPTASSEAKP